MAELGHRSLARRLGGAQEQCGARAGATQGGAGGAGVGGGVRTGWRWRWRGDGARAREATMSVAEGDAGGLG